MRMWHAALTSRMRVSNAAPMPPKPLSASRSNWKPCTLSHPSSAWRHLRPRGGSDGGVGVRRGSETRATTDGAQQECRSGRSVAVGGVSRWAECCGGTPFEELRAAGEAALVLALHDARAVGEARERREAVHVRLERGDRTRMEARLRDGGDRAAMESTEGAVRWCGGVAVRRCGGAAVRAGETRARVATECACDGARRACGRVARTAR
eukprot:6049979-Prymnesium_polylepis.1